MPSVLPSKCRARHALGVGKYVDERLQALNPERLLPEERPDSNPVLHLQARPAESPPTPIARAAACHRKGCVRAACLSTLQRRQGLAHAPAKGWLGAVQRLRRTPAPLPATNRNPKDRGAEPHCPSRTLATGSASATTSLASSSGAAAHGFRPARKQRRPDRHAVRCWPRAALATSAEKRRPRTMPSRCGLAPGQRHRVRRAGTSRHCRNDEVGAWGTEGNSAAPVA